VDEGGKYRPRMAKKLDLASTKSFSTIAENDEVESKPKEIIGGLVLLSSAVSR